MKRIIIFLLLVAPYVCEAQQASLVYAPAGDLDASLRVMVTPTMVRVVSVAPPSDVKRSIGDAEYLAIAEVFMQIMRQEMSEPASVVSGDVANPTLMVHVFSADRAYTFSGTPTRARIDEFLGEVGRAIAVPDLKSRIQTAQPGATDNPGDAQ
jgi:hypothetical protein